MEAERRTKKCSACGGETGYVRDICLKSDLTIGIEFFEAGLYRCPTCGHFDFYEREGDRETKELEDWIQNTPDYCCPVCGRVSKLSTCPLCRVPGEPVGQEKAEAVLEPERPGKKKRRWFGRDDDKPDWEG